MLNKHREWWPAQALLGLMLAGLLVVLIRCGYLQYFRSAEFRRQAAHQQLKIIPRNARRGSIVDRQGRVLAVSTERISVRVDPVLLDDIAKTARTLAKILAVDEQELQTKLQQRRDKRFMWVKRFVTDRETQKVRSLKIRGVVLEREYERQYPMGQLTAHVLGFTDIDSRGLEGVEAKYEEYLAGKKGCWRLKSDARRRPIGTQGEFEEAQDGDTIVLSIDAVIQTYVEEQLDETVKKFQAKGATGIVMDPYNGQVLALANWPRFDPARARQSDLTVRRNRALTDPVEPGSTFKPFTVAAALEGNFVRANDKIYCHEGRYAGKGFGAIKEYDDHGYGDLTVTDVIVRSSNIGVAKIAQKMGKKHFYGMIEKFGFGKKTGIDLSGEGAGILRPLSEWKWGDYALTRAAFGQGPISATPIQLMRGFCCLVNGGRGVQPRVVLGVLSPGRKVLRDFTVQNDKAQGDSGQRQVLSQKVSRQMTGDVLRAVVDRKGGTAHNAYIEGYSVFGKTGTANIAKKDGKGYEENKYISSFIAGAPAEHPAVCVLVMVYEPDRSLGLGYTGGMVAAPAVREILRQTLAYLDIRPPNTDRATAMAEDTGQNDEQVQ